MAAAIAVCARAWIERRRASGALSVSFIPPRESQEISCCMRQAGAPSGDRLEQGIRDWHKTPDVMPVVYYLQFFN